MTACHANQTNSSYPTSFCCNSRMTVSCDTVTSKVLSMDALLIASYVIEGGSLALRENKVEQTLNNS